MPNVFYNQDATYFCSHNFIDVEPYDEPCAEHEEYDNCGQCVFCTKQDYTLVAQDPNQRHLISPERK